MMKRRFLPMLPALTVLAMLGPVAAGLWGTVLPAFGHLPAAGLNGPSLDPITALFSSPGLFRSVALSVTTGVGSTVVALLLVTFLTAAWSGTRIFRMLERLLSPLLSVPHAAAAFGLAFLIAPSGWIARIRLPVYVVLAYGMSVVDVAIILGPNTPPPLSVQVVKWMSDPDIAMRTQSAAAALLQLALVIAALLVWRISESIVAKIGRTGALDALGQTTLIAAIVTFVALVLTIGCLEAEYRYGLRLEQRGLWLLYLPLLVPQTAFLPGFQTLLLGIGADVGLIPVLIVHIVFVLPYVFLSLADPFRAWDRRIGVVASALGAGPDRVLWRVRLPMLLRPILTAIAVPAMIWRHRKGLQHG